MPRFSLVARFTLIGLFLTAVLAVGVGAVVQDRIEDRALYEGERLADVVARVGVQRQLRSVDLERPLTQRRLDALERRLGARFLRDSGLERVKVFARDGRVVYSDDRSAIGTVQLDSEGVRTALSGRRFSELEHGVEDSGDGVEVLEVYVPLRWEAGRPPAGVLEVYLDYAHVAAAVSADKRSLAGVFALAAGLGFLTMFRIVFGASRRLRHQALNDDLTGLPNRALLYERLERTIACVPRSRSPSAPASSASSLAGRRDRSRHDRPRPQPRPHRRG